MTNDEDESANCQSREEELQEIGEKFVRSWLLI